MSPRFAYHGTRATNLPRLQVRGLIPGAYSSYDDKYSEYDDGKHLFFSDDPEYLRGAYGDTILRFPWPDDAKQDMNKYERLLAHQFVSKKAVSADHIEVEQGRDWEPLKSAVRENQERVMPSLKRLVTEARSLAEAWKERSKVVKFSSLPAKPSMH